MKSLRSLVTLIAALGVCASASAAVYLKIEGIPGEAKDKAHAGWIEIDAQSLSLDVKAPRDVATGQSSGRRQHEPIRFSKRVDKSSPMLAKAMAAKQEFAQVQISRPGGRVTLSNVMIMAITTAGGIETVTFAYQKIEGQQAAATAVPKHEKQRPPTK